jgi:hypothetical protein
MRHVNFYNPAFWGNEEVKAMYEDYRVAMDALLYADKKVREYRRKYYNEEGFAK